MQYKNQYGQMIANTKYPQVWKRKEGGHFIRARVTDPRTNKLREIRRVLPNVTEAAEALRILQEEIAKVRVGADPNPATPSFATYCLSLFRRRVDRGKIQSASTLESWQTRLKHLQPFFGPFRLDAIRLADIERWCDDCARQIAAGKYHPRTANNWLMLLKTIMRHASAEFGFRNPAVDVEPFDTSTRPTYTDEQPNSLTLAELPIVMDAWQRLYPQHYALVTLGFSTGLRPSSLRPFRRQGPAADILWDQGILLVRRSHSRKQVVMEKTKTGPRSRIPLPDDLMAILRDHVQGLGARGEGNDLLFPSRSGALRATNGLRRAWRRVLQEAGIAKCITSRAMRRTFQDLGRAAKVEAAMVRAISGHATTGMQEHYSTYTVEERRATVQAAFNLIRPPSGVNGGVSPPEMRN